MIFPGIFYAIWGIYAVFFVLGITLMVLTIRLLITLNRYFTAKTIALNAGLDDRS